MYHFRVCTRSSGSVYPVDSWIDIQTGNQMVLPFLRFLSLWQGLRADTSIPDPHLLRFPMEPSKVCGSIRIDLPCRERPSEPHLATPKSSSNVARPDPADCATCTLRPVAASSTAAYVSSAVCRGIGGDLETLVSDWTERDEAMKLLN